VTLYVCEQGATAPSASADGAVSPCPAAKVRKPIRRHRTHGKKKAGDDDDDEE